MSHYDNIIVKTEENITTITLNRPEALNALSTPLMEDLITAITVATSDDQSRVIVITGNDKAFAAGADIKEMKDRSFADMYQSDIYGRFSRAFENCTKPVIAAVSGYALGGGCELVMMCDFTLAAANARFGQPEVKLGTLPGIGGSQRLTRLVGKSKAMELCLTGRLMDAAEAERIGLVARILDTDDFQTAVQEIAREIAGYSPLAVSMVKAAVNQAEETTLAQGLAFERNLFYASFSTEDQKEGMAAFLDKRSADFKSR
jgi:enoyl-CoA hydratase/carnithine racemase